MPPPRIGSEQGQRLLPLLAAVALLLSLTGCALNTLTRRTAAFSLAATPVTVESTNAYQLVERTYRDAQIAHMVATYDESGFDTARIRPFLNPQGLQIRTDILNALRSYVELLAAISSSDDRLAPTMKSMGASLEDISASKLASAKLSADDATTATGAINALAHILIDQKRRRDLPGILHQMQQPIETLSTLLQQDIGDPDRGGLRNELHISYLDLIRQQKSFLSTNAATLSPSDKRREILILPELATSELAGDHALFETQKALAQLALAHTTLAATAAQKNAPAFELQLSQLSSIAQQLHSSYASLSVVP